MTAHTAIAANTNRISLDPFGFYGASESAISGLGAADAPPFPGFVFQTPYIPLAGGPTKATLTFDELMASSGDLVVGVDLLPDGAEPPIRRVKEVVIPLATLARGGVIRIEFEALAGASYALSGLVRGDTDASATSLHAEIESGDLVDVLTEALAQARGSFLACDERMTAPVSPLIATTPATMAYPVSQMCTASQFAEPEYHQWLGVLNEPARYHRKQWEVVYILRVLDREGMLRPGRRGLGFAVGKEALPAIMAARGAEIVATDLPEQHSSARVWSNTEQHGSLNALRYPRFCEDAVFDRQVSFRPVDMTVIPADLQGFDFCWSACAYEHLGSIEAGLRFVEDSLGVLRPGGIAVHTSEFNVTSNDDTLDHPTTSLFRRRDMEELALRLIAKGHKVARIKLDSGTQPPDLSVDIPPYSNDPHLKMALMRYATTSFGIIVQKRNTTDHPDADTAKSATSAEPASTEAALLENASEMLRIGRHEDAILGYATLIAMHPESVEARLRRADLLREVGRIDDARADLFDAGKLDSANGWPFLRLAQWSHALGHHRNAATFVGEAVRREPKVWEFRINAAAIFGSLGWYDLAFHAVRDLPMDLPSWWATVRLEAETNYRAELKLTRDGFADRTRRELCSSQPLSCAETLFKLGRLTVARRICEQLMREQPHSLSALVLISKIVSREGGAIDAANFLAAFSFLHDSDPDYLSCIALLRAQADERLF